MFRATTAVGLIALLLTSAACTEPAKPLSQEDRAKILGLLKANQDDLQQTVASLTAEQLSFKPAPDRWSVAECLEHITLFEGFMLSLAKDTLAAIKPNPEMAPKEVVPDDGLVAMLTNREEKREAPEQGKPTGRFGDGKATAQAFAGVRSACIQFVETTQEPLREKYMKMPVGGGMVANGAQILFLTAAHAMRHTQQIKEVMADPAFPKAEAAQPVK